MFASELLRLIVQADTQGAVRGVENLGRAAKTNLGDTESRLDKVGRGLTRFGTIALTAGAVVGAGLYKAGQAAADLEQAVGGTRAVFGDTAGVIDSFAQRSADSMGLSERAFREATTSIGGQLKRMTGDVGFAADKSIELTQVAADLAATYGGTTAEAVQALGAAFRGEADPAERFNLNLKISQVNAKAVALGLAETESSVSEAAKAQATYALIMEQSSDAQGQFARESDTAAGAMQRANAQFEDAKASLGQSVAPIMADVASKVADLASGFQSLNESTGGALSKVATFGAIALVASGGISLVVGQVIKMRDNFAMLKGPLTSSTGGLSRLGKAAAGLGFVAAAFSVGKMAESLTRQTISAQEALEATEGFTRALSEQDQQALRGLESMGKLDGLFNDVAASSIPAAERMLEQAEAAGVSREKIDELRASLDAKKAAEVQAAEDTRTHSAAMEEALDPTGEYTGAQGSAAEVVDRLQKELDEATEAITDNYNAMHEATNLAIDYEAGIDDLITALQDNGTTLDITTEKGRANMEQVMATGEAIAALIQKKYEETGSIEDATAAGGLYVENLKNQLREAGFTEDAIANLITQMHLTPEEISTRILADTAQADEAIRRHKANLASIANSVTTTIRTITESISRSISPFGNNATGTPFWRGGMTWVGERGPELVDLPRGSRVFDAHTSAAMAGGGIQRVNMHVHLDGREIVRAIDVPLSREIHVRAGARRS